MFCIIKYQWIRGQYEIVEKGYCLLMNLQINKKDLFIVVINQEIWMFAKSNLMKINFLKSGKCPHCQQK